MGRPGLTPDDRTEAARWLGLDTQCAERLPDRIVSAVSGPLDLSDIAHISGFEEMTHHDREQVSRFLNLLKSIGRSATEDTP